jgi:phosphate uptake regulator
MFKDILKITKRTSLLRSASEELLTMLGRAEHMLISVPKGVSGDEAVGLDIARSDRDINAGERMVRRLILEHLTFNPDQDLPASLALLSVVHDAERLGDYVKSLMELNQWVDVWNHDSPQAESVRAIHETVCSLFEPLIKGVRDSAIEDGRLVMQRHEEIKMRTDTLLEELMEKVDGPREAAVYALASRYLRRISAHMANIASSLVNPLDQVTGKET